MTNVTMDENAIKNLFKRAITEVLEERPDLLSDALEEALEEVALSHAIEQGEATAVVSRETVFERLSADDGPNER